MNPVELLTNIKGRVPLSLYDELAFQVNLYSQGHPNRIVLNALFEDTLLYLKEQARGPMVRKEQTSSGMIYRLNDEGEQEEKLFEPFGLLSEPTEEGFLNSFHDIMGEKIEVYRPDNPLELKGRAVKPLSLDSYPDFILEDGLRVLGCDIAAMGDDKSVLVMRIGTHVVDVQAFYHCDTNEMTGRIMDAISEHKPGEIVIDTTGGWGSGIYSNLVMLNIEELCILTPIHFNQKPRDDRFNVRNARAEMFMMLQERFREGRITLPRHKEMIEELSWIKYKPNPATGQFDIQPKEICKKDNKRSPDHADALALAFYVGQPLEVF